MPVESFRPRGQIQANKPNKGGAGIQSVPVIGVVRDNIDPTRSGRIKVSLAQPNSSSNPDDSANWISVSYLSTFFGKVEPTAGQDGSGTYKTNPSSYGQWQAPPDIGTQVVCIFVNGDQNYGFYIGAIPESESLQMVPAIGASENVVTNPNEANSYGGAVRLPVTNMNTNDKKTTNSARYLDTARPVHSYSAAIMMQQGIIRDPIRGPISSSASREPASRVGWGVSTPGRPIYEGGYDDTTLPATLQQDNPQGLRVLARRGGHSIVMDDGDIIGRDQLIRIRTALGHQILMSDDGQTLMILHSNGQSYVELGKEGTIDMYSTNSVNVRTQGDLNFHADRDINFHAVGNINAQAKQIKTGSTETTQIRAGTELNVSATKNITGLAGGALAWAATGDASVAAGGQTYITGTKVNLNSGKSSVTPKEVTIIPLIAQTDTLHDEQKGFIAAPGKLQTITTRAPAHAPWANAGQGVDVKTNLSASGSLPSAASPATAALTAAGAATGVAAPALSTVASAPTNISPISSALDKGTTSALLGATATSAASGPFAAASSIGTAIATTASGKSLGVGAFALNPTSLMNAGVIKPGSATLVNSLISQGASAASALPTALFTGQSGAKNLLNLTQNITAQTAAVVTNMQKSQTALGITGILSGKESPTAIAGLVQSVTLNGMTATKSAITPNAVTPSLGVLQAVGAGVAAAGLSANTGGLGGISNALVALGKATGVAGILDPAKGVVGSAFAAIKNSFSPLTPGVPQNLTQIAKASAATAAGQSAQTGQFSTSVLSASPNVLTSVLGAFSGTLGSTGSFSTLAKSSGSVNSATGMINNSVGGLTGSITSATSLLSLASTALNTVSKSPGSQITTIGGITGITSTLSTLAKNIPASGNPLNLTTSGVTTAIGSIGGIAGAGATLSTGGFSGLSTAAAFVQRGSSASISSSIASGLSNLPGGVNTTGSIINNAPGAINLVPGSSQLSGIIKSAQSAAMSGLSPIVSLIPKNLNSLTTLASNGLSVGATTEMQSALSSLSSGPSGVTLPTIGFNTTDRTGITAQIKNILDDPGIPEPNFVGEIPDSAKSDAQQLVQQGNDILSSIDQLNAYDQQAQAARQSYESAANTLPAGDPSLPGLLNAWTSIYQDPAYIALKNKVDGATSVASSTSQNSFNIASGVPNTTGNGSVLTATPYMAQGAAITVSNAGTSLTQLSEASLDTSVPSFATNQSASSLEILQASASNNIDELNNSINGITGPTSNS